MVDQTLNALTNEQLVKLFQQESSLRNAESKNLGEKIMRLAEAKNKQNNAVDNRGLDMVELVSKNINGINSVIWPFFFTSVNSPLLAPNTVNTTNITITQEAPFILVKMVKSVFRITDYGLPAMTVDYIDPQDTADQNAPGLQFTMSDSQSGKSFFDNPIDIDHIGDAKFPYKMPSPFMMLPNSNFEISYYNNHASNFYVAWLTFIGYRLRIDNAQNLLGLVTA